MNTKKSLCVKYHVKTIDVYYLKILILYDSRIIWQKLRCTKISDLLSIILKFSSLFLELDLIKQLRYAIDDKVHLTVTVNTEVYTLQRAADDNISRHAKHTKTNLRITYTKLALLHSSHAQLTNCVIWFQNKFIVNSIKW